MTQTRTITRQQRQRRYWPMNPVVRDRWIEHLLSGEYVQGTGHLRCLYIGMRNQHHQHEGVFDVLGVLCHSTDPDAWKVRRTPPCVYVAGVGSENRRTTYLPRSIMEDAMIAPEAMRKLAEMNDYGVVGAAGRCNFRYLAEWIGANL